MALGDQLELPVTIPSSLNTLSKGTFLYSLGNLSNYAVSFLLLPIFTRYLSPQDYGILSMLNVLSTFMIAIFSLGLGTSIGLLYSEKTTAEHIERTFGSAFFIMAISSGFLFLLGSFFASQLSLLVFHSLGYETLILYSVGTMCFLMLSIPLTSYMQLQQRAGAFFKLTLYSSLFTTACRVLFVVGMEGGVQGAAGGLLIGQSFSFLLLFIYVWRSTPFLPHKDAIKRLLLLGLPMIPSFAILFLLQKGNQYILQSQWGLRDVGIYTVGHSTGTLMSMFVAGFTTAWTPFFLSYINKQEESKSIFSNIFSYYVIIFGFVTLLFFIFAKPFVLLMTGPSFLGAHKVIGLVATSEFLLGTFALLLPAMYYRQEVKFVPLIQGTAAFFGLIINWLLIARFRYMGAALGLAAGIFLMALFQLIWNRIRGSYYLQIKFDWKRIGMATLFYGFLTLATFMDRSWPLLYESFFSAVLVFVASAGVFGLLTGSERAWLLSNLKQMAWKKIVQ